MKRKLVMIISIVFALVGTLMIVAGCKPAEEERVSGPEVGVYYNDTANGEEWRITLSEGCEFVFEFGTRNISGTYVLEDTSLSFYSSALAEIAIEAKPDSDALAATLQDDEIVITWEDNVVYRFLKKIDFTVKFSTGGGTSIPDATVVNGKTIAEPEAPTKGEEVFVGWYTDSAFRNLYYFSRPVRGDLTLYARFVQKIDPEFTVTFEAGAGASEIAPQTTAGGKLYRLPTPEKEGAQFVGWYVSQFYTPDKLSYRYDAEMAIEENLTLYAVWDDGCPVVSVNAKGVEVSGIALNSRYSISIVKPDGTKDEESANAATYAYDFASKAAGEYVISVTQNEKTTTLYYHNKALARVSVFKVEESTLLFNGVSNAQHYLLSVECGSQGHEHKDIDLNTERSWSFVNCDMPKDGFKFTVKATADGYVTSESQPFVFSRTLDKVENLSLDQATELITWDAVPNARSYYVSVLKGTQEVFAKDIGEQTSFSFKTFGEGDYTVKVQAVARAWNSSEEVTLTYSKNRLATPSSIDFNGYELTWTSVEGAEKYVVTVDGKEYQVTETTFSFEEVELAPNAKSCQISVRAVAAGKNDSLASDTQTLLVGIENGMSEVTYQRGVASWNPILGVSEYEVTVDNGEPVTVSGTSYKVTFGREGEITISVRAKDADGKLSEPETVTVTVYKIAFDMSLSGATTSPDPLYLADGDPVELPSDPTFYGYTFDAWYTAPGGSDGEGRRYTDSYFTNRQDSTLYAGWTANEHTITFVIGKYGKDEIESQKVRFGEKIQLPRAVSNDSLRAFSGWHYDNDAGVQLTDFTGQMIIEFLRDEDTTVYASYVEVFIFAEDKETGGVSVSKGPGIIGNIITEVRIPSAYSKEGSTGEKPVTRILDFTNCNLEVIEIPDSIKLISTGAFDGDAALREINVYQASAEGAEARYSSDNGVLLDNNPGTSRKEIRYFPIAWNKDGGEYTIPDGVIAIPLNAFNQVTGLITLNISHTVIEIQQGAFNNCTSLATVNFLPTPAEQDNSDLDIRPEAFVGCDALTKIVLPARLAKFDPMSLAKLSNLQTIEVEEGGIYSAVDGLLCAEYKNNETVVGKEIVFAPKGKDLGVYTIPTGIVSVGENAFFEHPKLTGVVIPGFVVNIGSNAFGHIKDFASVEFKGTAEDHDLFIREKAFYGGYNDDKGSDTGTISKLTSLRLPANLVFLGRYAFGRNSGLKEVWVDAEREKVDYQEMAFSSQSNSLMYVTTAHIGAKCPAFSFSGVFGNKLSTVDVAAGNPYIKSDDNVIFDVKGENILFFPMEKGGEYTIPDTVKEIAPSTFAGRTALEAIKIPASVARVGANAFNGCNKLTKVEFIEGEGEPLTIETRAFYGCTILNNIVLPERLEKLGTAVFYNCRALESIKLPKNLTTIEQVSETDGARFDIFDYCVSLAEVTVDERNTYYTGINGVLYRLEEVKKLDGTEGTEYVPYEALYTSVGAQGEIKIPATVHILRTKAIQYIPNVTRIVFEKTVPLTLADGTEISASDITFQNNALYGYLYTDTGHYNESVTEIVLPEGLTVIGTGFVKDWKGLTKITIPSTVTRIENQAFSGCTKLSEFTFAKAESGAEVPLEIGDGSYVSNQYSQNYMGVFSNYTIASNVKTFSGPAIESLTLPARTTKIGSYAFYGAPIKELLFEDKNGNFAEIGMYAFAECKNLTTLELPNGLKTIGDSAFYNMTLPTSTLPDTVETIGRSAFSGTKFADKATTLTLPANLKTIGDYAYTGYGNDLLFTTIDFSKATKLEYIGHNAFYTHKNLETVKFAEATDESPDLVFAAMVFQNDIRLNHVTLPANVTVLGETDESNPTLYYGKVFDGCASLTDVKFDTFKSGANSGKSRLNYIGEMTFQKTKVEKIVFPESTADELKLGEKLFNYCANLTDVTLSSSVHAIDNVFTGCGSIKKVEVAVNSEYFKGDKDLPMLYDAQGESILLVYKAVEGEFTIASGTRIGAGAFKGQTELKKVIISETVQEIGDNAFADCIELQSVEFKQGSVLTKIGDSAFANCYDLASINVEACTRLQSIGASAFLNCGALTGKLTITSPGLSSLGKEFVKNAGFTEIDISASTSLTTIKESGFIYSAAAKISFPSTLTTIEKLAFRYCKSLVTLDLSGTQVTDLSGTSLFTFDNCTALTTVKLPANIKKIGDSVFPNTPNLKEIFIGSGAANDLSALEALGQNVFEGSGISNVKLSGGTAFTTGIAGGAFENCTNLTKVEFVGASSLATIPQGMFKGCTSLAEFDFKQLTGLTTIKKQAFMNTALTAVDLSLCKGGSTLISEEGVFQDCTSLTSVKLPTTATKTGTKVFQNTGFTTLDLANFTMVTSWGTYNFAECKNLTAVTIPQLGANPGKYMFQNCTELNTVTFKDDYARSLSDNMFCGCTALKKIDLSKTTKIATFGTNVFQNSGIAEADLSGTTAKSLGNYMFDGCEYLTKVDLPKTLTHAGTYTFRNCTALETIDFSQTAITRFSTGATTNVTATTKAYTFEGCEKLSTVKLPENFTQIGGYVFLNCKSLKNFDLSKITKFGAQAFMGSGLTGEIALSAEIDVFGEQVFTDCLDITGFTGADAGKNYKTQSGMIVKTADNTIVALSPSIKVEGDTLKITGEYKIGGYLFQNFSIEGVTKLDLSALTVDSLPNYALYGTLFEEIILPDTITSLGTYTFAESANLKTVHLSTALTTLGNYAFQNCANLTTVNIPAGVTNISDYAFSGAGIISIDITETVTRIGFHAFENSKLQSITIPETVEKLGQYAFSGSAIASVTFEGDPTIVNDKDAVQTSSSYLFKGCTELKTVNFGPHTAILGYEFQDSGLESITIPQTVVSLGTSAFSGCLSLHTVVFEGNPIGDSSPGSLFKGCVKLKNVTLPSDLVKMPTNMFDGCVELEEIHIPESVISIVANVFLNCTSLRTVNIPQNLDTLQGSAFKGCTALAGDIVLPDTLTTLGTSVFENCTSINSVELPASVGKINANVFTGWTEKQEIRFRNSRFEVCASCGVEWLNGLAAKVVFNYGAEE